MRVTAIAAARLANSTALMSSSPRAIATASAPLKVSPAAVVSTGFTVGAGIVMSISAL